MFRMSIGVPSLTIGKVAAYLSKNAQMGFLLAFMSIIAVMEVIENRHAHQFISNGDGWLVQWNWVLLIPSAIAWLWAEAKAKYYLQFFAGVVFCFCGPTLLGGAMFREYSCFSFWEGELLFGGMAISFMLFFFGYLPSKFSKTWDNTVATE